MACIQSRKGKDDTLQVTKYLPDILTKHILNARLAHTGACQIASCG